MDTDNLKEASQRLSPKEQIWQRYGNQLDRGGIAISPEAKEACLGLYRRALTDFAARVPQVQANAIPYITGSALEGLKHVGICPSSAMYEKVRDWSWAKGAGKNQISADIEPEVLHTIEQGRIAREAIVAAHHFPSDLDILVMEEGTQRVLSGDSLVQLSRNIFSEYGVYIEIHPQLVKRNGIDPVKRIGQEFDIATLCDRK